MYFYFNKVFIYAIDRLLHFFLIPILFITQILIGICSAVDGMCYYRVNLRRIFPVIF
jgi:hypothetical protein